MSFPRQVDIIAQRQTNYSWIRPMLFLSLGNLSDEGADALLQLESKRNLKRLDLHYHYISKPLQKKLKQLPFAVDLSDAKTAAEEDEFSGQFISVSE